MLYLVTAKLTVERCVKKNQIKADPLIHGASFDSVHWRLTANCLITDVWCELIFQNSEECVQIYF